MATAIGHVRPSKNDTCETQVQLAAQSSRLATFMTGKETVYKAACTAAPAAGGQPKAREKEPKTSAVEVDADRARRVALN